MGLLGKTASGHARNLCLPLPRLAEVPFACSDGTLSLLTDEGLFSSCGTRVCFTGRRGGASAGPYAELNLSHAVGDDEAAVDCNRRLLLDVVGAGGLEDALVSPNQVHGDEVVVVDDVADAQSRAAAGADGVVCCMADVPVLLVFADCTPVVAVAPDGAFAVMHAGWRGALSGIAGKGLALLAREAGCEAAACNVYIGPHIGACCYEVSADLLERFVGTWGEACDAGERHLDLTVAVTASLLAAGASAERIVEVRACTACSTDKYYSHRAERGMTGRHGAFAIRFDDGKKAVGEHGTERALAGN